MFVNWNFRQFIYEYLAIPLRTPKRLEWLNLCVNGIKNLYDGLVVRRNSDVFLMRHNGQTASLESLLNSLIPIVGKPIKIVDADNLPDYYLLGDNDPTPNIIDTYSKNGVVIEYNPADLYMFDDGVIIDPENEIWLLDDEGENLLSEVNFYVLLDFVDTANIELLENYVNIYKLLGVTYKIILY